MIQVENLTKSFRDLRRGQVLAVDHISFEARPGEIFRPAGSQRRRQDDRHAHSLHGIAADQRRRTVAGYDVVKEPGQVRQHIGFMSASTAIYDRMSAWELVEYFGRLYGLESRASPASAWKRCSTTLQMNDFRDVLGAKMSTGMKQKVSIARAIIHDPPVLIFDEPTAGLDVLVARAVLENIDQLRALGKCILFSTHIMREVERLCDRVAIISRGGFWRRARSPSFVSVTARTIWKNCSSSWCLKTVLVVSPGFG